MTRDEIEAMYKAVDEACERAGIVDMFGNPIVREPKPVSAPTNTKPIRPKGMGGSRYDRTYSGDRPRALPYRRKRGY